MRISALLRGFCAVLVLGGVALCATAEVRDLPDPKDVYIETFDNSRVTDDASKAGMLERMISHLNAIGRTRPLTAREKAKITTYKHEVGRLYGQYRGNQTFLNRAAMVKLRTGDNYIRTFSPQLMAEYGRVVAKNNVPPVRTATPTRPKPKLNKDNRNARVAGFYLTVFGLIVAAIVLIIYGRYLSRRALPVEMLVQNELSQFGATREERIKNIAAFFENPLNTYRFNLDYGWFMGPRLRCFVDRNLATMDPLDRALLQSCLLLANEGGFSDLSRFYHVLFAFVYGQGQAQAVSYPNKKSIYHTPPEQTSLQWFGSLRDMNFQSAQTLFFRELNEAIQKDPKNPVLLSIRATFTDIPAQKPQSPDQSVKFFGKPNPEEQPTQE